MENYFSRNLRLVRKSAKLSTVELAERLDLSKSSVNNYENGENQPDLLIISKISSFFGIPDDVLVYRDLQAIGAEIKSLSEIQSLVKKMAPIVAPITAPIVVEDKKTEFTKSGGPVVITLNAAGDDNIVMVSTKAAASYPVRFLEPEFYRELPVFQLPGGEYRNGLFRAFEVQGDSMSDTLYAGDVVIARYLDRHVSEVRDGYIHVIITADEVLVKRVLNRAKQGKLILKSDNESYGNIVMPVDQVKEIWLVKSKISLYLPNRNADIGKIINDLQARVAILEEDIYRDGVKKRLKGG